MRALNATEVGELVRERRRSLNLSQDVLAQRAGVARSSLGLLERGHERAELAVLLRVLRAVDLVMDLTEVYVPEDDDLERHLAGFDEPHTARGRHR